VSDIQDAIETAVGGKAVSQVLPAGSPNAMTWSSVIRSGIAKIGRHQQHSPGLSVRRTSGSRTTHEVEVRDGAYDIYREGNSRYLSVTFNVRGRD